MSGSGPAPSSLAPARRSNSCNRCDKPLTAAELTPQTLKGEPQRRVGFERVAG